MVGAGDVIYRFEIPGRPQAKQSMRVARIGHAVRTYQPTEVTNYHGRVATFARLTIKEPIEGPVKLMLIVRIMTPKSWSKKRQAGRNWATCRPDLDNLSKAIMDGLNGVAWHDDRQVVGLHVEKHYGDRDAVEVSVGSCLE